MANIKRGSPLQSLIFFEAAVRHLNFTAVAEELGTSQPAVTQRINSLEKDLGVALFRREHRGVALTAEGSNLFEAIRENLAGINDAIEKIRSRRTRQVLTVATDFAFANFWLIPRLAALQELLPNVDVRIVTSQNEFDIRGEAVDLAISFGAGQWPGCEAELIMPEVVVPVCSPGFLAKHKLTGDPEKLRRVPLLHLESDDTTRWMTWKNWFILHPPADGPADRPNDLSAGRIKGDGEGHRLLLGNFPLVIQAAVAGQGVALAWVPLVDELIRNGQLAAVPIPAVTTQRGYHIVRPNSHRTQEALDKFRSWIVGECGVARAGE